MADGVDGDDEETFRGPLPLDDRLWRHPSELSVPDAPRQQAPWGPMLASATIGAVAVGALWLAVGSGTSDGGRVATRWVSLVPVESVAPQLTTADDWGDAVTRVARSGTATVHAHEGSETIAGAVALRDDGFYVTSGRAIGDAETVTVVTESGSVLSADVIGYDPDTDISVIRVDESTTPAVMAHESRLEAGDTLALVNPSGGSTEHVVADEATTTRARDGERLVGIVALDGELGSTPPGSPAVDETGAVVGLTTATADAAVAVVPIELANTVADELIASGSADHPRLGVTFVDDDVAGALVSEVQDDGPAALGGVLPGDIVVELAGTTVESMAATIAALRTHRPGEVIEVIVRRDGALVGCQVKLGADI